MLLSVQTLALQSKAFLLHEHGPGVCKQSSCVHCTSGGSTFGFVQSRSAVGWKNNNPDLHTLIHSHLIPVLLALCSHTDAVWELILQFICSLHTKEVFVGFEENGGSGGILTQLSNYTNCTVVQYLKSDFGYVLFFLTVVLSIIIIIFFFCFYIHPLWSSCLAYWFLHSVFHTLRGNISFSTLGLFWSCREPLVNINSIASNAVYIKPN